MNDPSVAYGWNILFAEDREGRWQVVDATDPSEPETVCKAFHLGGREVGRLLIRRSGELLVRSVGWVQVQVDGDRRVIIVNPPDR